MAEQDEWNNLAARVAGADAARFTDDPLEAVLEIKESLSRTSMPESEIESLALTGLKSFHKAHSKEVKE